MSDGGDVRTNLSCSQGLLACAHYVHCTIMCTIYDAELASQTLQAIKLLMKRGLLSWLHNSDQVGLQEVQNEGDIQVRTNPPLDFDQGEGHTAHG